MLAEWYELQRQMDYRFYRLACCHFKEPPPPEYFFPLLGDSNSNGNGKRPVVTEEPGDDNDLQSFREVTHALTSYGR